MKVLPLLSPTSDLRSNRGFSFFRRSLSSGCLLTVTNPALNQLLLQWGWDLCGACLIYVENQKAKITELSGEFIWTIYSLLFYPQSLSRVHTQILAELNYFLLLPFTYLCLHPLHLLFVIPSASNCFLDSLGSWKTHVQVPVLQSHPHSQLTKPAKQQFYFGDSMPGNLYSFSPKLIYLKKLFLIFY